MAGFFCPSLRGGDVLKLSWMSTVMNQIIWIYTIVIML